MNSYLLVIILSLILAYALETLCSWLTARHLSPRLPESFAGVLDADEYARSQEYTRRRIGLEMAESTWSLLILLAAICFSVFRMLDDAVAGMIRGSMLDGPVGQGVLFLGILGLGSMILGLPFRIYSTFVLEQRFGFNTTSVRTFILDRIKGGLLGVLIGGPILAAILWFFSAMGDTAWILAWLATVIILFTLQYLAPSLILPLFNTFTPMQEGGLKQAIDAYAQEQGFTVSGIFVMDGSRRSTKSNAFFTGFGKRKRIALFDTMIARHDEDEILAVLAHEVGHSRLGHLKRMMAVSVVQTGAYFFLLSLALGQPELYGAFGLEPGVHAGLLVFAFLLTPVRLLLEPLFNAVSRRFERQADAFAARTTGKPEALASALRRLAKDNYSNLTPHPLNVILHYSHPPVLERVQRLSTSHA